MQHRHLQLPPGDVLLHAGDLTLRGTLEEVRDFADWWHEQRASFAQRLLVAGNHDLCLDQHYLPETCLEEAARARALSEHGRELHALAAALLHRPEEGSAYLLDSACRTQRGGYSVWGAPWQPEYWGAFNLPRKGASLECKWAAIPHGTHVVLTHGPPAGKRDYVPRSRAHVGCELLWEALRARVRPAAAVFGHIHEGHGVAWAADGGTAYINAASVNVQCELEHPPIVFQLLRREGGDVMCRLVGCEEEEEAAACVH